jgi:teichuronic acid biosynthesis protein TuaE
MGGPNEYGMYLAFSCIFLFLLVNYQVWWPLFVGLIFSFFVIYRNDAKAAFLTISIQIIVTCIIYRKEIWQFIKEKASYMWGALTFLFFIIGIFYTNDFVAYKKQKDDLNNYSMVESFEENINSVTKEKADTNNHSSLYLRKDLVLNGVEYFIRSYGLGIGGGNFETYTKGKLNKYYVKDTIDPHCWLIEILSEYGILVFAAYIFIIVKLFLLLWKHRYGFVIEDLIMRQYLQCTFLLLTSFLLLSNASSSFFNAPINWLIFFLVIAMADKINDLANQRKELM